MIQHVTYIALPVVGVEPGAESLNGRPREVCGTASPIGGDAYLTAGHVWTQSQTHPLQALGMINEPDSKEGKLVQIRAGELIEGFDLAVLKAPPFGHTWRWRRAGVALLDTVETYGYPFGFDAESEMVTVRAFKGHIVGGGPLKHLGPHPAAWETSFACPRGLSGAPLIRTDPSPNEVIRVILGNSITEIAVYTEKETLTEHGRDHTLIKTEALHLGVAIKAEVVLDAMSSLLGCTIGDWLGHHNLLAP